MNYWFADHTDFRSAKKNQIPDVFILGGVLIDKDSLKELEQLFREIKSDYTHPNMPIKYNLKDLKEKYVEFGKEDEYKELLYKSYQWRKEIFRRANDIDYQIIIACIESFKKGKEVSEIKENLLRYSFAMALMRVGMQIETWDSSCNVILDWPVGNNPKPFDREYYYAFNRGETYDQIEYNSGPLMNIGFSDSVYYANMNHSIGLQFSDLIIGAFRDGVKAHRDNHQENLGKEITKIFLPKIRSDYNSRIIQRGVIISNSNNNFKTLIKDYLNSLKN